MKTANAFSISNPLSGLRRVLANIPNPATMLRAQEQLNKFRAMDDAALKDAGLTREDVARATLADFLNNKHY